MVTMVGHSLYIVHLLSHHVLLPYVCTRKHRFYMAKQSKMYMTHDKVASKV